MTTISIDGLCVTYSVEGREIEALRDITLEVKESEFVCLVGPSGCGKTTLLNVLGGFVRSTKGKVSIADRSVTDPRLRKGFVFQQYALFPWLTVADNVALALEQRGLVLSEARKEALRFLDMVGLADVAELFPHRLSGGMQQRTAVARALAFDPDVLLFDEPFAALDAFTRERLQALVEDLSEQTGKTFVYVTHNISEAVHLADRIVVMSPRPGQIKQEVQVSLPHPRKSDSPEFAEMVNMIRQLVES